MSMDNFRNNFKIAINKVFLNLFKEYINDRKYKIIKNLEWHQVVQILSGRKKVTLELLLLIEDANFLKEFSNRIEPILDKVRSAVGEK